MASFVNKSIEAGIKEGMTKLLPDLVKEIGSAIEAKSKKDNKPKKRKKATKKTPKKIEVQKIEKTETTENSPEETSV